jgi:hypothetical protein
MFDILFAWELNIFLTKFFNRPFLEFKGPYKSGSLTKCLPCIWVKTTLGILTLFKKNSLFELMLMSPGVNFTNVLRAAFTLIGPKSAK